MYYYLKLAPLANNYTETAVLSLLCQGHNRAEIAGFLQLSYKQICRVLTKLYGNKATAQVAVMNREEYEFPYVYLKPEYIKEFGLGAALYLNFQRTWNHGTISPDTHAHRVLGLSRRSITNYKHILVKKEVIKEGRLDMKSFENVFNTSVKEIVKAKHSSDAREKIKGTLKQTDIPWIFKALCAEYGYHKTPPPLKSDIAKVVQIQKALEEDKSQVTVGILMERMIKKWPTLWGKKPATPTLGHLSIYYKDLWEEDSNIITVKVTAKEQVEPATVTRTYIGLREIDAIDDYNERMIGGE